MAGMNVSSNDTAQWGWLETARYAKTCRQVSTFQLHLLKMPGGGTLQVQIDSEEPTPISTQAETLIPLLVGIRVPEGAHRMTIRPAGDGEVRVLGAVMEKEGPGVVVDAMGIGGKVASDWLLWNPDLQDAFLHTRTPVGQTDDQQQVGQIGRPVQPVEKKAGDQQQQVPAAPQVPYEPVQADDDGEGQGVVQGG